MRSIIKYLRSLKQRLLNKRILFNKSLREEFKIEMNIT